MIADIGRAAHLDAERAADRAVAAAAIDEIAGGDLVALVAGEIVHDRDHAAALLAQLFEAPAEPQLGARKAGGALAQDRVEPDLVATLGAFRTHGGRRAAA